MNTETRWQIMLAVRATKTEEYYKQAVKSKGIDETNLTHAQICAFKAAMDAIEADIIYEIATTQPNTGIDSIDVSVL